MEWFGYKCADDNHYQVSWMSWKGETQTKLAVGNRSIVRFQKFSFTLCFFVCMHTVPVDHRTGEFSARSQPFSEEKTT